MGLSIHYEGRIKDVTLVDQLTDEIQDICNRMKWKSTAIDIPQAEIRGIIFASKMSELIQFCFHSDCRLVSPLLFFDKRFDLEKLLEDGLSYMCHTKTHYAGPDKHIAIIELMRYITEKYFSEFKMYDETRYWETKDKQKMLERFAINNAAMDAVAETLSTIKRIPGENPRSAVARIERILKEKFGGRSK